MIIINEIDNDKFVVYVKSDEESKHTVIFEDKYYLRFNKNKSKREIIKESFKFLLKREPNTQILKSFKTLGVLEILKTSPDFFENFGNLRN